MTRRCQSRTLPALLVAAALALTACGSTEPVRDPYTVDDALPEVDASAMWLPTSFEGLGIVDPGWDTVPQYAQGVYLAAGQDEGVLEFTAVDVHGEVLWAAQRPASCTGFVVTTDAQDRALAVLADTQTTEDALAGTTATAYDLATGKQVWGPVEVPGPHQGPGLVFAAPPEGFMGETGPRAVLDPTTGRMAATESDPGNERVIGEYHGTMILADDDALIARDTIDHQELWTIPLRERGWTAATIRPSLDTSPGGGLALIETSDSGGALIDLHDGTILSQTARDADFDRITRTLVILDEAGLHAYDANDDPLWSLTVAPGTTIAALGGAFLYLREDEAIRVHNVITGKVADAYDPDGDGPIVVPEHITNYGAGLLLHRERHLLATTAEQPNMGDTGS